MERKEEEVNEWREKRKRSTSARQWSVNERVVFSTALLREISVICVRPTWWQHGHLITTGSGEASPLVGNSRVCSAPVDKIPVLNDAPEAASTRYKFNVRVLYEFKVLDSVIVSSELYHIDVHAA